MRACRRALVALGTLARLDGVEPVVREFTDSTEIVADGDAIRQRGSNDGYLFFRGLAPTGLVEQLRADVAAQCARRGWLDGRARASRDDLLLLQADVQTLPAFSSMRAEPRIVSVLELVFDAPVVAGCGDVCRLAFPNDLERTTQPHQDHFYTRGSTSLWTVWTPLGDCPAALGGLAVFPGSHVRGLCAHDGGEDEAKHIILPDDIPWVSTDYRAGDVLMFNALTIHGARPNVTEHDIRMSIDCRYRPRS